MHLVREQLLNVNVGCPHDMTHNYPRSSFSTLDINLAGIWLQQLKFLHVAYAMNNPRNKSIIFKYCRMTVANLSQLFDVTVSNALPQWTWEQYKEVLNSLHHQSPGTGEVFHNALDWSVSATESRNLGNAETQYANARGLKHGTCKSCNRTCFLHKKLQRLAADLRKEDYAITFSKRMSDDKKIRRCPTCTSADDAMKPFFANS
jgi:hypothetical protein